MNAARADAPGPPRAGRACARRLPARLDVAIAVALWAIGTLAAIVALAPVDAGNDQALFAYYGRRLLEGVAPYLELWDNKQPGIFAFYAAAAALFGPGWDGVRLLYALWLGAGAGLVSLAASAAAPHTHAGWIAAVLAVGVMLLRTDYRRAAQVESIVPLLLVLLLWLCTIEPGTAFARAARWVGAGVAVGAVALLKLVLAPVAATIMAVALAWRLARGELRPTGAIGAILAAFAGFALAWAPVLAHIAQAGALAEFRWTMLEYPRLALVEVEPQKPQRLVGAFRWLATTTGAMLPAVALALWRLRGRWREVAGLVALACVGWVLAGLVMFRTQRFSWWDTHMDLVTWPIAVLAALGVTLRRPGEPTGRVAHGEGLAPGRAPAGSRDRARVAVGALAALGVAVLAARLPYKAATDPDWPRPARERAALETARAVAARATAPCGTVYAIGDQAGVERATGLAQAAPTHGLWFGAFLPSQAARLPDELRAARPDLVYFDGDERRDFQRRQPEVARALDEWLERHYRPLEQDAMGGRWWQRRTSPDDATSCPRPGRFTVPQRAG